MSLDPNAWFTEIHADSGSAFSLAIKGKVHEEQTPYQTLAIYETTHFGYLMTLDGCVMLTSRDNFIYHEMMTHPALCSHPEPKRVLIIGGGDCGCLREVLKHPSVTYAHQVDIDERVTRNAEVYFPELCESNDDPRAELSFIDGVAYIEDAEPGSFDVVIVDSVDPVGQAARLYSEEFYAACCQALGDEGILVAQSESPLLHDELIRTMRARMRQAGFNCVDTLYYPQCSYPSGWWSATLACKALTAPEVRNLEAPTRYYNSSIHRGALAAPQFMRTGD